MVAGADRDLVAVEDGRQVVGMDALDREGDDTRPLSRRRPEERDVLDLAEGLQGVLGEVPLVGADSVQADPLQVVEGGAEANDLGDRHRARLELDGHVGIGGALLADGPDHVAAGEEGIHLLQNLAPAVKDSSAGRAQHLVRAEGVEVAAGRLHVDAGVRRALGAVDKDGGAGRLGRGRHLGYRVDGAHRIRDLAERNELGRLGEKGGELVLPEAAALVDVDPFDPGALLGGEDLPGDDVGVVLEDREHDQVALAEVLPAPAVGDQVDALGGSPGEYDLPRRAGVDVALGLLPGRLVALGSDLTDPVGAAVDVGVELCVVLVHRGQHLARPLRGVGAVEVDDPGLEDREVPPDLVRVEPGGGRGELRHRCRRRHLRP